MKWHLEWDGENYVVWDESGRPVASARDKRIAVEWALAQAVKRRQSVEIVESRQQEISRRDRERTYRAGNVG